MNDQVLMRILDGLAHGAEKIGSLRDVEPLLVTVPVDRLPFDVLHYVVGEPFFRRSRIH